METFIRSLCLSLAIVSSFWLNAEESLYLKGDYFIFSDDLNYIYGGSNLILKGKNLTITGEQLYLDVNLLQGVIYGQVELKSEKTETGKVPKIYDAIFFRGIPPNLLLVSFGEKIITQGDPGLLNPFLAFSKKKIEELKKSSLFFEFREFRINKNQKIKARTVIPYMMGLPTVPLKKLTIKRGDWAERTMISFDNVNYSGLYGLSLSFFLRMREKTMQGDYNIKLYERELFNLEGVKRGVLLSANSNMLSKGKELINFSTHFNTGIKTFNLRLNHKKQLKLFDYSLSQNISIRENQPTFLEFSSDLRINRLKLIVPRINFSHDLKNSFSYQISSPLNLWKKLNMNLRWHRKILKDNYQSNTSDFSYSLGFQIPILTLSSNYNYTKNLTQASIMKNFSTNIRFKPVRFIRDNILIDVSTFYMFSAIPFEGHSRSKITPGINIAINSFGIEFPLGFKLIPNFAFNHLWNNQQDHFTDFNYLLSLQKGFGKFSSSIDYSLVSRYRAENFWIEGNNLQNLNLNLRLEDPETYDFLLRFYYNNSLDLENISFSGKINLPYDFILSSYLLYYNREKNFQTVEIFIEKAFRKKIKIQGGYSLALKRFFIKFLTY